jgi:hypothetical protein
MDTAGNERCKQGGSHAHDGGACRNQQTRRGDGDLQRTADFIERARHNHDAGADHEIAKKQRPQYVWHARNAP